MKLTTLMNQVCDRSSETRNPAMFNEFITAAEAAHTAETVRDWFLTGGANNRDVEADAKLTQDWAN